MQKVVHELIACLYTQIRCKSGILTRTNVRRVSKETVPVYCPRYIADLGLFQGSASVYIKSTLLKRLAFEDGTHNLFRNVGKKQ